MKVSKYTIFSLLVSIFLSSCVGVSTVKQGNQVLGEKSLVVLDNEDLNTKSLGLALKKCHYTRKEYALRREQARIDYIVVNSKATGKMKNFWLDKKRAKEEKFNLDMEKCMEIHGVNQGVLSINATPVSKKIIKRVVSDKPMFKNGVSWKRR